MVVLWGVDAGPGRPSTPVTPDLGLTLGNLRAVYTTLDVLLDLPEN